MSSQARAIVGIVVFAVVIAAGLGVLYLQSIRPAHVIVEPVPAEAMVTVNGHTVQGRFEEDVPAGPARIEVKAEGYLPYVLSLTLQAGDPVNVTPRLSTMEDVLERARKNREARP